MESVYCTVRPQSVITTRILIVVSKGLSMYAVIVLRCKLQSTCKMKSYKHEVTAQGNWSVDMQT